MSEYELTTEYFNWLCSLVRYDGDGRYRVIFYGALLHTLFTEPFDYQGVLDENRYEDGISMRYRFGSEKAYDEAMIATTIDTRDCSMLEMMVALARRCESDIMSDSKYGNRTGEWFWDMISSLGLDEMTDDSYDETYVLEVLFKFYTKRYSPDGRGGLFTVPDVGDLREKDIWWQLNQYLALKRKRGDYRCWTF